MRGRNVLTVAVMELMLTMQIIATDGTVRLMEVAPALDNFFNARNARLLDLSKNREEHVKEIELKERAEDCITFVGSNCPINYGEWRLAVIEKIIALCHQTRLEAETEFKDKWHKAGYQDGLEEAAKVADEMGKVVMTNSDQSGACYTIEQVASQIRTLAKKEDSINGDSKL